MAGIHPELARPGRAAEELAERLMRSVEGAFETFGVYLGDQLGLYQALAAEGPATSASIAAVAGTHERYTREWLEQQAVAGLVAVENPGEAAPARRYFLPEGHREVLTDPDSLNYMTPFCQLLVGAAQPIEMLLEAFRTGGGVPYGVYGRNLREGQGRMNRAMFLQQLGPEWLASVPALAHRLKSAPAAQVADIGCGVGWSAIGMALAYPGIRVDGFDLDGPSVEEAAAHAEQYGVAGRVRFQQRDAADSELAGQYDLVTALECVHDMSDPVGALRTMRRIVNPGGWVFIADERVADHFTLQAGLTERLMYGFSILHCLPVGMADQPSAGTGTVMRASTLRDYAAQAGFSSVGVLPLEHSLFRFYVLRP